MRPEKPVITYRYAEPEDAAALLEYLKTVGGETDNLTFGAEGFRLTEEQERKFLESTRDDPYNRLFLALDGDRIVGDSSLNGSKNPRMCHRRELGISVLRDYWGLGIGSGLMERMIDFARRTGAEQLTLGVRADNVRAKALYRKFGFVSCGVYLGYMKVDGRSFDVEFMVLELAKAPQTPGKAAELRVRFAREEDLPAVNRLRREVNELHVQGRPETFKPGFSPELENYLYVIREDPAKSIVAAEAEDGSICGFAVLHELRKPENPFKREEYFLDVDEFGVAAAWRRRGVGRALMDFIRAHARERGFDRVELNMWEFNREALGFYEAVGFSTYRRYMETRL